MELVDLETVGVGENVGRGEVKLLVCGVSYSPDTQRTLECMHMVERQL